METKEQRRTITHLTDQDGNRLVHVPLDNEGTRYAIADELIYQDLVDLGLSPIWRIKLDRGQERVVYWNRTVEQLTSVARVIADAGFRQAVTYANGNPLDLRSNNLVIGAGKGIRHDRKELTRSKGLYPHTIVKHEYINNNNNKEINNE